MNIRLQDGLPFVELTVDHQGQRLVLSQVLLETAEPPELAGFGFNKR